VIVCSIAAEPRYKCPVPECSESERWYVNIRSIRSHCRRRHKTGITIESREVILARQHKRRLCFTLGRRHRRQIEVEKQAIRDRMSEIMADIGKLSLLNA
jgi:hypothetical protein